MDGNEKARCEKLIGAFKAELERLNSYVADVGRHGYVLFGDYNEKEETFGGFSRVMKNYAELKAGILCDYEMRRTFEIIDAKPSKAEREERTDRAMKEKKPIIVLDKPDQEIIREEERRIMKGMDDNLPD